MVGNRILDISPKRDWYMLILSNSNILTEQDVGNTKVGCKQYIQGEGGEAIQHKFRNLYISLFVPGKEPYKPRSWYL